MTGRRSPQDRHAAGTPRAPASWKHPLAPAQRSLVLASTFFARRGIQRTLAAGVAIGLVAYLAIFLIRYAVWPLVPKGDASIFFQKARLVFDFADYPARLALGNMHEVFPYSPSAVLLFRAIAIEPALFMATWLTLMIAGFFVTLRASVVQERSELQAIWPFLGAIALVVAGSPVEWDLRNANSNLICLGLVLAGYGLMLRKPLVAGILIALSISLKPYSALLMVWLFAHGPRKAAYAAAVTVIALWVILPIGFFGLDDAIQTYIGWQEQIRIIAHPWVYAMTERGVGPPLVTLKKAAMTMTGEGPEAAAVRWLVGALLAAWTAALIWYASRALRPFQVLAPSRAALADWTVLLLAPLPFSPWLEPYHAVPIMVGAMLCLTIAADELAAARARLIAVGAIGALALIRLSGVPFPVRGLGLLAQFLVLVIALGILRPKLENTGRTPSAAVQAGSSQSA